VGTRAAKAASFGRCNCWRHSESVPPRVRCLGGGFRCVKKSWRSFATLGLFVLTNAKRLADAISIIHLPHDVEEFLTSMSQTPILLSYAALAIGIICLAYLAVSPWWTKGTPKIPSPSKPPPVIERAASLDPNWSRDVSLAGSLWRAFQGDWMNVRPPQTELEKAKFQFTADQIRQHAFDGSLPVWGRRKDSNLFEPIPREFWQNHAIEADYSLGSKDNRNLWVYVTHPLVVGEVINARTMAWEDFMTSNEAVEKLWPRTLP
jgi:hypothetical protein